MSRNSIPPASSARSVDQPAARASSDKSLLQKTDSASSPQALASRMLTRPPGQPVGVDRPATVAATQAVAATKRPAALERYSNAAGVRPPGGGRGHRGGSGTPEHSQGSDSSGETDIETHYETHRGAGDLRIVVANDHRGYDAKVQLLGQLKEYASEILDLGSDGQRGCDYPDYAAPAARMVAKGEADAAILLDGSGIGMGIVANKVAGVRAATTHDEITARIAREHNHCNVLCVGVDLVSPIALKGIVDVFLSTPFSEGRHIRRVAKIASLEAAELERLASPAMKVSG